MDVTRLVYDVLSFVAKIIAQVHDVQTKYPSAPPALGSIVLECQNISSSLGTILTLSRTTTSIDEAKDQLEIWMQVETEIGACEHTMSTIAKKLETYTQADPEKTKFMWEEEEISELLGRLRGHHAVLATSLSVISASGMEKMRKLVTSHGDTLNRLLDQHLASQNGASDQRSPLSTIRYNGQASSTVSSEGPQKLNVQVTSTGPYLKHLLKTKYQLEEEKKRLEDEKRQWVKERIQLLDEKKQMTSQSRGLEDKRRQLKQEKQKLEAEKRQLEQEKHHLLSERIILLGENKQLKEERKWLEKRKKLLEYEKRELQEEKRLLEDEWVGEKLRVTINSLFELI